METVKESYFNKFLKRFNYRWQLKQGPKNPDFVLAIGERTAAWVAARGYPQRQTFTFTYFLEQQAMAAKYLDDKSTAFRIGFVGQLIPRKRVDLLINALAGITNVELVVVGDGPLAPKLKDKAKQLSKSLDVQWLGKLPMDQTRETIASLDCLVLPSDHDGWGAVIVEALMAGVPAICSDACGATAAVRASGVGGVFPKGDIKALRRLILQQKKIGKLTADDRQKLAFWADCFNASSGATYLNSIFMAVYGQAKSPLPPWQVKNELY